MPEADAGEAPPTHAILKNTRPSRMCRPLVRCTLMDRPNVEIHNQDPILHVLYDLGERDTG